jgi:hypothetical protein
MKPFWPALGIVSCLVSAYGLPAHPSETQTRTVTRQTAIANEKSLIEAKKKDDGQYFKRTLTSDFSLVGIDGMLLQGEAAADNLGDTGLEELTPYDIEVVPLGDNGAVVTYDAIVREAPQQDQDAQPRYQHFSSVWMKQGGQWKLKFHQATAEHWGDW